jgi:hypothetical protein
MQPSRKREGKPAEYAGEGTVEMQPPPKGGGKSVAKAEGKARGPRAGHSWVLANCRWQPLVRQR